jgi:PAS domain S-box-containing protein
MPAKLLIVDDEVIVAESMRVMLAPLGYTIVGLAGSSAEALALVEAARPDLVLMDINLGAEDAGITAAEVIRSRHQVPVVFATAYADAGTLARAKITQPFGYVTKPFEARDLQVAIEIALYNHARETQLRESERKLREQHSLLTAVFDSVPSLLLLVGPEGKVEGVNHATEKFAGRRRGALMAQLGGEVLGCLNAAHPPGCGRGDGCAECPVRTRVMRTFRTGTPIFEEEGRLLLQRDGETVPADFQISTALVAGAAGPRVLLTLSDVTERKRYEAALAEKAETYRALLSTTLDGVIEADAEARIIDVNPAYCRMTGYSRAELLTMGIRDLEAIEDAAMVGQHTRQALREGGDRFESQHRAKDGRRIDVEVSMTFIPSRGRFVSFIRDISERRKAEIALRASDLRLQCIWEQSVDGMRLTDAAGRIVSCNESYCRLVGQPREALLGQPFSAAYSAEYNRHGDVVSHYAQRYARRDFPVRQERRVTFADGRTAELEISTTFLDLPEGQTLLLGLLRDVTERRQAQEALQRSEARLVEAQRVARLGSWEWEMESNRVTWSDEMFRLYDVSRESFDGSPETVLKVLHPDDAGKFAESLRQNQAGLDSPSLEYRVVHRDGSVHHLFATGQTTRDAAGRPVRKFGTVQDITESKQAEAALRASEAKFRSYVDLAPVGVVIADACGVHLEANRAAEEMLGFPPGGMVGTLVAELPVTEDAELCGQSFSALKAEGETDSEIRLRHRDGSAVVVSIRATRLSDDRFLAIYKDVTEARRLQQERERLIRDLDLKNRELETLIYATSHDLRSPMLNIQGFAGRIEVRCSEIKRLAEQAELDAEDRAALLDLAAEQLPKSLAHVQAGVNKMDRLISGLLRLSRLGRAGLNRTQIEPEAIWREIVNAMAFSLQTAGATVEIGALPPCYGDAGQISQLFTNLLDNAVKYRDPARPLQVTVSGRLDGARVVYSVADTGTGIAAKYLGRIWEIFFRAHPGGDAGGEGLGLNLVRRIVERHEGEIWVDSVEGRGSVFQVALPAAANPEPPQGAAV